MPYGDAELCQYWLRYRLDAWCHKTSTWTNVDITISMVQWQSPEGSFTITHLKFHSNLPGANKLTWIILCMRPANERWRYNVTPSLIGWAHTQNDPWFNVEDVALTVGVPAWGLASISDGHKELDKAVHPMAATQPWQSWGHRGNYH